MYNGHIVQELHYPGRFEHGTTLWLHENGRVYMYSWTDAGDDKFFAIPCEDIEWKMPEITGYYIIRED